MVKVLWIAVAVLATLLALNTGILSVNLPSGNDQSFSRSPGHHSRARHVDGYRCPDSRQTPRVVVLGSGPKYLCD